MVTSTKVAFAAGPGTLVDAGFESGADAAAVASPPWTIVGAAQHAEYDTARAKVGTKSAWLQGPAAAGSAGIAESASAGMTSDGAELRFWMYADSTNEVRYLYDLGATAQAFTVRLGGDGTIATYTNAGKSVTGYTPAAYTTVGNYQTGWTQVRITFDFTGDTLTLSTRRTASDAWTQLKSAGASGFAIPMRTTDDVAQSQTFRVAANSNADIWLDDVAYSNTGIADATSPATLIDAGFESGIDAAAVASPPWMIVGAPQHAEYDTARAKVGTKSAWLQGPAAAGSAGIAESESAGMTSDGAELRFWMYADTTNEVRYLYDLGATAQAFTIRLGGDGTIASYTNAPKSVTGYTPAAYTTVGTYQTGWTQVRVVFDFSGDTFTLSTRRTASEAWTQLKSAGASGFAIPMRATDNVTQSQTFRVAANQNADIWLDDVAYSDAGIADVFGPYLITPSAGIGGSIWPLSVQSVASGANSAQFSITPASGYTIASVLVDGISVGTPSTYTFTSVTADHTIAATFAVANQADMAIDGYCGLCHSAHGNGDECDDCHDIAQRHPGTASTIHIPADTTSCSPCHNSSLTVEHMNRTPDAGGTFACITCHQSTDPNVTAAIAGKTSRCWACHTGAGDGGHSTSGGHAIHITASDLRGPAISCDDCHESGGAPYFKSGADANGDGHISLAETDVCDDCHSAGGQYNGVVSSGGSVGAKTNWSTRVYDASGALKAGMEEWCVGCHDDQPSTMGGVSAANKAGNGSTFGYYRTGHGRETTYAAESWQALSAQGNSAADKSCAACHDAGARHIDPAGTRDRLKAGLEDDAANSNCVNCHDGGGAVSAPRFYTDYAGFASSAHATIKCSRCHDAHGTSGASTAMTTGDNDSLCTQCHAGHSGHALGTQFGKSGEQYVLRCASCHNVHVIGKTSSATTPTSSSMSLFTSSTVVWGDEPAEKMNAYAARANGKYQTPAGESLDGTHTPDYVTFCVDCHATSKAEFGSHGGIDWASDNHGLVAANAPNGTGASPNWYTYGKAAGWDGDDVVGTEAEAWPVIPRGLGEQIWTRDAYSQRERIAGANFVLSCSNCHVTHEAGIGQKLKTSVNGGPGSVSWNTMCNNCHYYYSDWHAGMACGNASCHVQNSIHGMQHQTGSGATHTFNNDLVGNYRFENNLKDTGSFLLNSKWFGSAGTYVAGKIGQAISLNGDQTVQVGTENANWSTDEGYHGTWKYTEMKYNTTLEAWVNSTDTTATEYTIFSKHVGYADGGYALTLKKIDGTWRAVLNVNVSGTGTGVRGAYSSVDIRPGRWTHVAASFDKNGPDRNPADPSVGRIRIFVDGEDVTCSDPSGTNAQPGAGENFIFPFSMHSFPGDLDSRDNPYGYDGHWCASEFGIGGFEWQPGFVGSIDEAKVWNVTKPAAYFEDADQRSAPRITAVKGMVGSTQLAVQFSEGVYASAGAQGALQPSDFTLDDVDNLRSVVAVSHLAGSATATLTLSAPVDDAGDLNADLLTPAVASIFDEYNNIAPTDSVLITPSGITPAGEIVFDFNEAPGSTYILDRSGLVAGTVFGGGSLNGSAFVADGVDDYVEFANNSGALVSETTMTIEARIQPQGFVGTTGTVIQRILGRTGSTGNWQVSVWRMIDATSWPLYTPAAGDASIAFWVRVQDAHGGQSWKPVLTEATNASSSEYHPVVAGHWYAVKVVWNTYKSGGTVGQPFVPAEIWLDDQGTDGSGAAERWSGYVNATDADQSQFLADRKLYANDKILSDSGTFRVGSNTPSTGNFFNGSIDWIRWSPTAE